MYFHNRKLPREEEQDSRHNMAHATEYSSQLAFFSFFLMCIPRNRSGAVMHSCAVARPGLCRRDSGKATNYLSPALQLRPFVFSRQAAVFMPLVMFSDHLSVSPNHNIRVRFTTPPRKILCLNQFCWKQWIRLIKPVTWCTSNHTTPSRCQITSNYSYRPHYQRARMYR